ncbi:hypothetical protein [uncultured Roseovarius sp.]|uniref:hypothetical protein n=1 Tax=Roseovarius sp. TaxID=1486281 RepID=UPI0025E91E4F|nr:hypothetical protein [uncultured Roseovarius sp.]
MSLATVLRLNALSCFVFGGIFLLQPSGVAAFLGAPPVPLIAALGAALLINAALLWASQHKGRAPQRHEVLFFCLGDGLWVLATLVLLAFGLWITATAGQVTALGVAAMVGTLGVLQWRALPVQ